LIDLVKKDANDINKKILNFVHLAAVLTELNLTLSLAEFVVDMEKFQKDL
jgi:hypothetical protein